MFITPSLHESFSIVLMEAWLQGTPALIHASCAVTRQATALHRGGLAFGDFGSCAAARDLLLGRPALRQTHGTRRRAFVLDTCRWENVACRPVAAVLG